MVRVSRRPRRLSRAVRWTEHAIGAGWGSLRAVIQAVTDVIQAVIQAVTNVIKAVMKAATFLGPTVMAATKIATVTATMIATTTVTVTATSVTMAVAHATIYTKLTEEPMQVTSNNVNPMEKPRCMTASCGAGPAFTSMAPVAVNVCASTLCPQKPLDLCPLIYIAV